MEEESSVLSLVDLYEDKCDMLTLLGTKLNILNEESEKWNGVLHSHMKKVLQSTQFLKIKSLGTGLDWLNITKPLSLDEDLKDKVIVLDFFTYCCINCEHVLPYLHDVEEKFDKNPELIIIGVHSPKFPNEKDIGSVKNAVLRYKITHPVINDPENSLWNELGVYCWPTVVILSPDHRVLFSLVGEMQIEKLGYICNQTINYFKMHNSTLNLNQLCINARDDKCSIDILLYPSSISIRGPSIMVSDTGHNRLLFLSIDGEILDVIGSGTSGFNDGWFASSSFHRPHGTAWWNNSIVFVADTGNHAIRMIDLNAKRVSTIFDGQLLDTACNDNLQSFASPWDICFGPELGSDMSELKILYIAVAGSHQIWSLNLERSVLGENSSFKCTPFAGNGKEECRNNTYKMKAGFAQPSGICYSDGTLFIADSESSTVRSISLIDGSVKTIVGGGLDPKDLFKYGDKDGVGNNVKLQHPIGICVMEEGRICITDTYNHKVKLINVHNKECSTVAGSGIRGTIGKTSVLESQFDEPSGICYSCRKEAFFLVDTNNHCIKFFDPEMKVIKFLPLKWTNSCCIDGTMKSNLSEVSACTMKSNLSEVSAGTTNSNHLEVSAHSGDSKHTIFCQNTKCIKINLAYGAKISCTFKLNQMELSLAQISPINLSLIGKDSSLKMHCRPPLFGSSNQPAIVFENTDDSTPSETNVSKYVVNISTNVFLCDNINNVCLPPKYFAMKLEIEFSNSGHDRYDGLFLF